MWTKFDDDIFGRLPQLNKLKLLKSSLAIH